MCCHATGEACFTKAALACRPGSPCASSLERSVALHWRAIFYEPATQWQKQNSESRIDIRPCNLLLKVAGRFQGGYFDVLLRGLRALTRGIIRHWECKFSSLFLSRGSDKALVQ